MNERCIQVQLDSQTIDMFSYFFYFFCCFSINRRKLSRWLKEVNQTEVTLEGLPTGSKITLNVSALANHTLAGDEVIFVSYTGNYGLMALQQLSCCVECL